MKKKAIFLIIPFCGLFLSSCDAMVTLRNIKYVMKETVKKVVHKLNEFIDEGEKTTEAGVIISYHY